MKIGILTLFHNNYNWGGVLQGYALKTLIEKEIPDTQVDILIYKGGRNIVYSNKIQQAIQYTPKDIVCKVIKRVDKKGRKILREKLKKRYYLFEKFMNEYATNKTIYSDENLKDAAEEYDCLISGSDQVWNPNVGKAGFLQQMISDNCKKISYAASIARDDLSPHERKIMIPLIERFDMISVREKTAKNIIEKYMTSNKPVTEVLDPALMLSKTDWEQVVGQHEKQKKKYALAFFFSDSYDYRKEIEGYCSSRGFILKFIPFAKQEYLPSDERGICERVYDVGPVEFVKLFQNAECVFTDSFHGVVFSLVFQKPFLVFERDKNSKVSKNSRLYDLLEKFALSDRLVKKVSDLEQIMGQNIDFLSVEILHKKYRKQSLDFLIQAIDECNNIEKKVVKRVDQLEEQECCGCSLCMSLCPKQCISISEDSEGFLYPRVDETNCISCGRCIQVCKKRTKVIGEASNINSYVGYHLDENVKRKSSSGGLFYALAENVLASGGCVYGAAFNECFEIEHNRVGLKDDLTSLMTSKYAQSRMDSVFHLIDKDLKANRKVLFCGTPCQVVAIYQYAIEKSLLDNLILVDFVCHGIPSSGVWKSYVKYLEYRLGSKLCYVNFRDKSRGWHDYHFCAKSKKRYIEESHELNPYMRTFLSDMNIRPSCYVCHFKGENYYSDITLGDAWKIEKVFPNWADDRGTSLFIIRTKKGKELLDAVSAMFMYRETNYTQWQSFNPSLVIPTSVPNSRKEFFNEYKTQNTMKFWNDRSKISLKKLARYYAKRILKIVGLDKFVRKIV